MNTATAEGGIPPLTRTQRLTYGFGAVANGVKNTAFTTYLLLFYNQVIGVDAVIVSTAIALTLLVDAVVDPFLGRWSDLAKTRLGRRHPFIFASAIPTTFFFIIAWFPPSGLTDMQMGIWIFAVAALTRASISAFEIPCSAMTPELTQEYTDRTRLFSLRYWFGYAGAYLFAFFSLTVFFAATAEYPQGQLNPAGYSNFAFLGGGLILIAILVCGFGTKSRIPYLRQQDDEGETGEPKAHLSDMLSALKNRGFLSIFGFGVFKYTAIGLYSATTLYFLTYVFKLTAGQVAILAIDSLIAASLAAPLAPLFSRWMGKRNASLILAVGGVSLGVTPLLLTYFGLFFEPGHPLLLPTLFVVGAVYGMMVAISLINTSSMLADVVEDHAAKTGRHNAGVFFSASSFMQQCSAGLGILAAGVVLKAAEFPEKVSLASVTPEMEKALLISYVPVSLGLWTIGALILLFYPITEKSHLENLDKLKMRAAEAQSQEAQEAPFGSPLR